MKNYFNDLNAIKRVAILAFPSILMSLGVALPAYAQDVGPGEVAGGAVGAIGVLALLAVFVLAVSGFSLIWRGLFPRKVEWAGSIMRERTWPSCFMGIGLTLIVLFVIAVLGQGGEPGAILAVLILAVFLLMVVAPGVAGLFEWLGEIIDPSSTGLRRAVLGSAAWALLICIPFLGWILMAGLLGVGIGASGVSYLSSSRIIPTAPPIAPPPPPPPAEPEATADADDAKAE